MASAAPQASPAPFPQLRPSPLALTRFDQAWKQPGLLFSLGNRSDGSQEPQESQGVCAGGRSLRPPVEGRWTELGGPLSLEKSGWL